MTTDQKAKSKPKVVDHARSNSRKRSETRLVIPPSANLQASDAALKQVIEDWLIPSLLDEFLTEHGITPKSRFLSKPE
jgi:hypothetical protein